MASTVQSPSAIFRARVNIGGAPVIVSRTMPGPHDAPDEQEPGQHGNDPAQDTRGFFAGDDAEEDGRGHQDRERDEAGPDRRRPAPLGRRLDARLGGGVAAAIADERVVGDFDAAVPALHPQMITYTAA